MNITDSKNRVSYNINNYVTKEEQDLHDDKRDRNEGQSHFKDEAKGYDGIVHMKGSKRRWSKAEEYFNDCESHEGSASNSMKEMMCCCSKVCGKELMFTSSSKASASNMIDHLRTAQAEDISSEGVGVKKSKKHSQPAEGQCTEDSPCQNDCDGFNCPVMTDDKPGEGVLGQPRQLKLSSVSALDGLTKQMCPCCSRKRMFFCYDCRLYMCGIEKLAPVLKLPVSVDIIKHPREKNGKSTALHCLLIAPTSTRLFDAPNVCDYRSAEDRQNTVLVYPSKGAISIEKFISRNGPIQRFVFLDATWFQVGGLRILPQIEELQTVVLKSYKTQYWRPQKGYSDEHLATIEAIYYAIREAFEASTSQPYEGQFDDLLFWFFYFRSKVPEEVFERNVNGRSRVPS
uniref:tRNA-uridine aminocarboxypropyltransferase 1 n=1 Tax=Parascaris univalens TaxID=6257 RepID=A0A915AVA2_PARUN